MERLPPQQHALPPDDHGLRCVDWPPRNISMVSACSERTKVHCARVCRARKRAEYSRQERCERQDMEEQEEEEKVY